MCTMGTREAVPLRNVHINLAHTVQCDSGVHYPCDDGIWLPASARNMSTQAFRRRPAASWPCPEREALHPLRRERKEEDVADCSEKGKRCCVSQWMKMDCRDLVASTGALYRLAATHAGTTSLVLEWPVVVDGDRGCQTRCLLATSTG